MKDQNREQFEKDFACNAPVSAAKPLMIDFETTNRCNFRCVTCPKAYETDKGEHSSLELFDKVADAMFETALAINLTGFGEPMTSPHFEHFYNRSVDAGLEVGFVTNGSFLSESWFDRFASNTTYLFLSVDTADPKIMSVMRPQLNFEKFSNNLKYYQKLRERLGSQHKCKLYFQSVPTLLNIDRLDKVVEWAVESGAERVEFFNYRLQGLSDEAVALHVRNDPERARRGFEAAHRRAEELGIPIVAPPGYGENVIDVNAEELACDTQAPTRRNALGSKYPLACSAPWYRISIYANGNVHPCCWYPYAMGNLFEASFDEVWNSAHYKKLRSTINGRFPHLGCKTCPMTWGICAGRPDQAFAKEGIIDRLHTKLQRMRRKANEAE